jgi:Xaa-Pro aminopeptidase
MVAMTDRIANVLAQLPATGTDLVVLAPSDNLMYVCGFSPVADERMCMLLLGAQGVAFVMPKLNAEQSAQHVPDIPFDTWADDEGPDAALGTALARVASGARRIAIDPHLRADHLIALQGRIAGNPQYVSAEEVLRPLREIKSEAELAVLARSAATADEAMLRALEACRAGASESEVASGAAAGFLESGADAVDFIIVASGPHGAMPHHHTGKRVLEQGDGVVIDLGGLLDGYSSDLTRNAFIGEPTAEYLEVHGIVEAAVQAALAAARPGATCGDVDAAARGVIDDAGYGEYFVHRTGHGLGISGHEPPWIMRGSSDVLREGMVFSIEPGIYLPDRFGVRLEEIVHTTRDGCSRFSSLPRDLHVVR